LSLNRNEKTAVVADVAAQVARSQTLALAEYRGLTVEHLNALRRQARDKGVYLHVLKNTLARRAVTGTSFEVAKDTMVGPLIYGFSTDAVAAAMFLPTSSTTAALSVRLRLKVHSSISRGHRQGRATRLRVAATWPAGTTRIDSFEPLLHCPFGRDRHLRWL
jgi:ribosomal protein L10